MIAGARPGLRLNGKRRDPFGYTQGDNIAGARWARLPTAQTADHRFGTSRFGERKGRVGAEHPPYRWERRGLHARPDRRACRAEKRPDDLTSCVSVLYYGKPGGKRLRASFPRFFL